MIWILNQNASTKLHRCNFCRCHAWSSSLDAEQAGSVHNSNADCFLFQCRGISGEFMRLDLL